MSQRLFVLGATGRTGQQVVAQALAAGHRVTVLARQPSSVPADARVTVGIGRLPEDGARLTAALPGHDAVISCLGRGASLRAEALIQRSVPAMLSAMQGAGVRRLIFTSAIGVGAAYPDAPLFSRLVIRVLLRDLYADKVIGEDLIVRSGLDWTIVQPAQLTNGPVSGSYRVGERLRPSGIPTISRADVAHFILQELQTPAYVRKFARLAY
jgi:putative NADH-flavin reductase